MTNVFEDQKLILRDCVIEVSPANAVRIINEFEPDYYVAHKRVRDAISRKFMFNPLH